LWRFAIIAVIYDDLHKPGMEVPMFKENRVLMENSWNTLNFRWSQPALASLLYLVIQVGASAIPIAGWFGSLVIAGPLMLGYVAFMVAFFDRAPDANIEKNLHRIQQLRQRVRASACDDDLHIPLVPVADNPRDHGDIFVFDGVLHHA